MTLPQASARNGHFKGTIAVDLFDSEIIAQTLKNNGLIGSDDRVTAAVVDIGKEIPGQATPVYLNVTVEGGTYDAPDGKRRTVEHEMTLEDFFSLFNEVQIVLEQR